MTDQFILTGPLYQLSENLPIRSHTNLKLSTQKKSITCTYQWRIGANLAKTKVTIYSPRYLKARKIIMLSNGALKKAFSSNVYLFFSRNKSQLCSRSLDVLASCWLSLVGAYLTSATLAGWFPARLEIYLSLVVEFTTNLRDHLVGLYKKQVQKSIKALLTTKQKIEGVPLYKSAIL